MNKAIKIILISFLALLGTAVLDTPQTFAQTGNLLIQFETNPLFNEANFLPSEAVNRWVEVTNNTAEPQAIKVKFTNTSYYFGVSLADVLQVVIKNKTGNELQNKTLAQFFAAGELVLSQLALGANEKYTFSITFLPQSENQYQELMVGFDLSIGTFGEAGQETSEEEVVSGGGGGGGGSFLGLEIYNEKASGTDPYLVTISWETNKLATSRVIYSSENEPHTLDLNNPPDYGYSHSTAEDSTKVTSHTVVISGLEPGLTYFYRCVSKGSQAISTEHNFTTLVVAIGGETTGTETTEKGAEEGTGEQGEEIIVEEFVQGPGQVKEEERESGVGEVVEEEGEEIVEEETGPNMFLAGIGNFFNQENLWWILILAIAIIIVLFLLSKKKRQKTNS